jgi:alpha-ketoglutarate-dependent taurine dioxygenase
MRSISGHSISELGGSSGTAPNAAPAEVTAGPSARDVDPTSAAGGFPVVVRPENDEAASFTALLRMIRTRESRLSECLAERGAILFRGFRIDGSEQFAEAVEALSGRSRLLQYRGGASPRGSIPAGRRPIYNSTEYPPEMELSLHNELSYSDIYPDRIYFFCLTPPEQGGETTLGDSRRILRKMPPTVRERFEEKGVCYVRNLSSAKGSGYSWQDAFESDDPDEVERRCRATGAQFEWLGGGILRLRQVKPATARHPLTREEVWFNQADGFHPSALDPSTYAELMALCGSEGLFRLNAAYGDGTPIEASVLEEVRRVIREETMPHVWQTGDILMLDNMLAAHGRRPFRGPRRIAVAMS